jgi:hypothetical protein
MIKPESVYQLVSSRYPYRFSLAGSYTEKDVDLIQDCSMRFFDTIGKNLGNALMASEMLIKVAVNQGNNFRLPYQICLDPRGLTEWTVTHELSHALDGSTNWRLSKRMRVETGSRFWLKFLHQLRPEWRFFWYHVGSPPPPCGVDRNFNSLEDFAESVTAYLFPEKASQKATDRGYPYARWGYSHFHETPRGIFVKRQIAESKLQTPSI